MKIFCNKSEEKYKEAKSRMYYIYKRFNSNIPDYNPFDLPTNQMFVKYPKELLSNGRIYQKNLMNKRDLRIYELNYVDRAQLDKHTHYGHYEYIYIKNGIFKDIEGNLYTEGDGFIIDGYHAHALKCETNNGSILIAFSKNKERLNIKLFSKYIK